MGLIDRIRRLHYIASWRIRFWWFDTEEGRMARIHSAFALAIVGGVFFVRVLVDGVASLSDGRRQEAIWWWLVQLIVAIALSYAAALLAPKPKTPDTKIDTPTSEEGVFAKHHFGTVWEDNSSILAWKVIGRQAIKTKGGKK